MPDHCALPWQELFCDEVETKTGENLAENLKKNQIYRIFSVSASLFTVHSLFTNLICFSSKFLDLPDHCKLPWQELFDDEIETKTTGKYLAGNQENSNLWKIVSVSASLYRSLLHSIHKFNLFQFKVLGLARSLRITLARTV